MVENVAFPLSHVFPYVSAPSNFTNEIVLMQLKSFMKLFPLRRTVHDCLLYVQRRNVHRVIKILITAPALGLASSDNVARICSGSVRPYVVA